MMFIRNSKIVISSQRPETRRYFEILLDDLNFHTTGPVLKQVPSPSQPSFYLASKIQVQPLSNHSTSISQILYISHDNRLTHLYEAHT